MGIPHLGRLALACSILLPSLPGPVAAGEPPPDALEGLWRVEGNDDHGAPRAGHLRVFKLPDGTWRYERTVRADTASRPRREQGRVRLEGAEVRLRSDAGGTFLQELEGGRGERPALTRYRLAGSEGEQSWAGERLDPDGRASGETLRRARLEDRNHVRLLLDGEAHPAMEAEIRRARRSIDIQTFQWADDVTGRRITEALKERAAAGVRVRLLVDGASGITNQMVSLHIEEPKIDFTGKIYRKGIRRNLFVRESLEKELTAAGCQVIVAHTDMKSLGGSLLNTGRRLFDAAGSLFGRKPKPREQRGLFNHDHRKTMVVDERVAFCGGMNIASEYEFDWHDAQVRVEGPAAHDFHALFVDRWKAAGGEAELEPAPCEAWTGDAPVRAMGSVPGVDHCIRDMYLHELGAARERIMIEVAYFLDDRVIDLLAAAVRRGVRAVVIIPSEEKNDVYLVKEAFAWVRDEVVRSGVELYWFQPTLTHAKLGVFDGERATVGSCNLDRMALDLVAEANAYVPDARFAREVERRVFGADLPRSVRVSLRPQGERRSFMSGVLHLFRGLL